MNKPWRWCWLIGLALTVAGLSSSQSHAGAPCVGDYAPGVVLVGLHDGANGPPSANRAVLPFQVVSASPKIGVLALRVLAGEECTLLEMLRRDPRVAYAELDYVVRSLDVRSSPFALRHSLLTLRPSDVITPDDPGWINQWGPAKIEAPAAWGVVTGTPDVVIAVLDTGVYLDHEDLASKLWTNPGEIPGNWVDDDGNGQVDDIHGWHFFHSWSGSTYFPAEDSDVRDDNGHGTHVAGIAAAAANNGAGIAGLAWGARIMPVKVLNQYGDGFYSDLAAGIIYAADNGARVINMSLGGAESSQMLCAAVDYARRHGAVVVSATGNDGAPWVRYPAACPSALAVAATDSDDQQTSFSNYGSQVALAAPGTDIYSTWCHQNIYLKLCDGNYYLTKSGTSMATPHVSGVAALIWSRWPALTADAVAMQITRTAVDVASPGWDEYTGWGRLNAAAAVTPLTAPADLWIQLSAPARINSGQTITYSLVYGNGGGEAQDVRITATLPVSLSGAGPFTYFTPSLSAASGPYTQTLTATVGATALPGTSLVGAAEISSVADLNLWDNRAEAITQIGYQTFLPILLKEDCCHANQTTGPGS
jgi:thermitase